jgi:P-type Ca2+ transporter type 2C
MQKKTEPWHAKTVQETLNRLEVAAERGLSESRIARQQRQFGDNRIREAKRRSAFRIWIAQFRSVVVGLLSAAAGLAFAFGKGAEGIAILAVVLVNSLIGFVSEWRAARSMDALRRMGKRSVRVRRNGEETEVPAADLVPGDICLHESGDMISSDLRLIEANNVQVDESALTGESVSVVKRTDPVEAEAALADRANMLYRGVTLTEGSAVGVVVATGMDTELGRIAEMADDADGDENTPLERRLDRLAQRLAWVALGAAAAIGLAGFLAGQPTLTMIETAIALGVAAIPEGLPFVATIALARGMWLMAKKHALINRLPAVETLGATNVILSDKTGTLTENRMVAETLVTSGGEYALRRESASGSESQDESSGPAPAGQGSSEQSDPFFSRCLEVAALCNNASALDSDGDGVYEETQGDPTEAALLIAAARHRIDRREALKRAPEVHEEAFDPDLMMMATVHDADGTFTYAVKGAPEAVVERCSAIASPHSEPMTSERRALWIRKAHGLASRGLRVLALADKEADTSDEAPYRQLRLLGLIGLLDPPRPNIRKSLAACREAGIRVVMVTGDQPETAKAIAIEIELVDEKEAAVLTGSSLGDMDGLSDERRQEILKARIFARVSPGQKLRILSLFQEQGDIVAMTGDGVNDAPALQKADIGVAMGRRGTDAARESADMVLQNDAFTSILAAIRQGRVIFSNIRKSVVFMLCTNIAEVAAVGVASLLNWPLPIRPLQILFLNVITDVFPALALSVGKGDPEKAMRHPPRPSAASILGRRQWLAVGAWSAAISVCVLGALMGAVHILRFPVAQSVTVSFLTLAFAKLWFVFHLREPDSGVVRNDIVGNPWIWAALALCVVLLLAAVYAPGLSTLLTTVRPGPSGWLAILALSALPTLAGQIRLAVKKDTGASHRN